VEQNEGGCGAVAAPASQPLFCVSSTRPVAAVELQRRPLQLAQQEGRWVKKTLLLPQFRALRGPPAAVLRAARFTQHE
jgi:hypothetical protein